MNQDISKFDDVLTIDYQNKTRLNLLKFMASRPMSKAAHARGIGISWNSMTRFLDGGTVSYAVICKFDRYMEENK